MPVVSLEVVAVFPVLVRTRHMHRTTERSRSARCPRVRPGQHPFLAPTDRQCGAVRVAAHSPCSPTSWRAAHDVPVWAGLSPEVSPG